MASEQGPGGIRGVAFLLNRNWGEVDGAGEKELLLNGGENECGDCCIAPNRAYMCQGPRESSVLQAKIKRQGNLLNLHLCGSWYCFPRAQIQSVSPQTGVG